MFFDNKYTRVYYNIINKAKDIRTHLDYTERHHVIPKSLGGTDDTANIVILTSKEHYICHHLLTKMCKDSSHANSMANAFFLMHVHTSATRYFTARSYAYAKKLMSETKKLLTGSKNHFYGKTHSEVTRAKMKIKRVDRICRLDKKIHHLYHPEFGYEKLLQSEFRLKYGFNTKQVSALITGKRKH